MKIDGIDVSGLSCAECPEQDQKRCLEQQEKYKSEIYYLLSFLENDFTKGQIEVLKTKISYPTRCDVVLEKQLQRAKAENDKFKNFVKDLLFDVSCENWLERFIFSFNDWKKEMVSENERLRKKIKNLKKTAAKYKNDYDKLFTEVVKDRIRNVLTSEGQ